MLGSIISGVGSLVGGLLGRKSAKDANEENIKNQREFAQSGIQWRVADAKKAGIHPLYALGAQTASFAPSSVGDPLGGAISDMGQNIGRAVDAAASAPDRAVNKAILGLQLERAGLENELLKSQIARERGQLGPPMPSVGSKHPDLAIGGVPIKTDPLTSNSQDFETRYGEPAEWVISPLIGWRDLQQNLGKMSFMQILREIDRLTSMGSFGSGPRRAIGRHNVSRRTRVRAGFN